MPSLLEMQTGTNTLERNLNFVSNVEKLIIFDLAIILYFSVCCREIKNIQNNFNYILTDTSDTTSV